MTVSAKKVRDTLWHYLNPETAAAIGLSLDQLKQAAGGYHPLTQAQLEQLARRMRLQ